MGGCIVIYDHYRSAKIVESHFTFYLIGENYAKYRFAQTTCPDFDFMIKEICPGYVRSGIMYKLIIRMKFSGVLTTPPSN